MFTNYNYYDSLRENDDITTIEKCNKQIAEEKGIIETHNFYVDILNYKKISLIKNLIIPFSNGVEKIWNIGDFINLKKKDFIEKHGEEKYKTAKKEYDLLKMVIEDNVLGHDNKYSYKITDVIKGGYETYYTSIYFTINDINFVFNLPHPNNINSSNCVYAHDGMYYLGYKESCCITYIKTSYYIDDIKKAFKEFIERNNNNA